MKMFTIIKPGQWLTGFDDHKKEQKIELLLYVISNAFCEACLAYNLFQESSNSYRQLRRERRHDIAEGEMSESMLNSLTIMYAKSFLYSFDTISKVIKSLKGEFKSEKLDVIYESLRVKFPELLDVRNSSHHVEDRVRGLTLASKKDSLKKGLIEINIKPIDNGYIKSGDEGSLYIDTMLGNSIGATLGNGHFGKVEITECSMITMQSLIQQVYDSFEWSGEKEILSR
ncbi:hypothetical protein CITFRE_07400 [Citrobacter freundii]|uniref:hypothetical protein n=1 Tax=Citrobacter freundii TaxID=546 RepID=UPI0010144DA8|nr:hypothetical protein [Citrobacter freundii]GCB38605.1 hypothetical protein CITFRE_07400 [Citrobacter freundii]